MNLSQPTAAQLKEITMRERGVTGGTMNDSIKSSTVQSNRDDKTDPEPLEENNIPLLQGASVG